MTLIPFTKFLIGIDDDGNAHAVNGYTLEPKPETEALCGVPVETYAVKTCVQKDGEWIEDGILVSWPPRVSHWRSLNQGERCRECYAKSGKPRPSITFDSIRPADDVFGPCDKVAGV